MVTLVKHDIEFILQQIEISETHAAASQGLTLEESRLILLGLVPNSESFQGLRTVDGRLNNLRFGQSEFGASDTLFPRFTDPVFRDGEFGTSYAVPGDVVDSQPRVISNLIVDQTDNNPAATAARLAGDGEIVISPGLDGIFGTADDVPVNFIPNVAPDEGLSAPFNAWFTFFGQFFDHGLDFLDKGQSGVVFMPLHTDDPLYDFGADGIVSADDGFGADGIENTADDSPNFLITVRATNQPGPDGVVGTADDIQEHTNKDTPFVDQNQTYGENASHQVFLRAFQLNGAGEPVNTGRLLNDVDLVDGIFGNGNDIELGGMATWGILKAQARDILGIDLDDLDVLSVPQLAVDQYGNFLPGANGFPQLVLADPDGILNSGDETLLEGDPTFVNLEGRLGVDASLAMRTTGNFLADIAHNAAPMSRGTPTGPEPGGVALLPDADSDINDINVPRPMGTYDDELLDAHFVTGDGRVNENLALTAVHHVFHSEHNRLVEHTKAILLGNDVSQDAASLLQQDGDITLSPLELLNSFLLVDVAAIPTAQVDIDALVWDGSRLFQVAKFGTEMQYQHLVFEEFARTMQPAVNEFEGIDLSIDPSITAEFAHAAYRLGHSMLVEEIDRFNPDFTKIDPDLSTAAIEELGLIQAFLNPAIFLDDGLGGTLTPDQAAGALVRGLTRQVGNEIDEFVTEAVRNNLLGLPLDLAAINIARGRDTGVASLNEVRRDFFEQTSLAQLKPYESWVDFTLSMKHEESVINFIAAYGTHATILAATTLVEKRAAAVDIVMGGGAVTEADRIAFLNSTGIYANTTEGVTTTGVDDVDLWIGGLAEEIQIAGGMLGSTFNIIFEKQLESLQDGDRFYYLGRTAALNFLTELENNSFSSLIERNTDATHLPGSVFSAPNFILEADESKQFNEGLGSADPVDPTSIFGIPLVVRDNPITAADEDASNTYLQYNGGDHVVLGGTSGNDTLIGGIGDDTVLGDDGDDVIEGGDGGDQLQGGAGDDIITDTNGDDVIKGGDGNDAINAGNGDDLVIGGAGSDFIHLGQDPGEVFGGSGNDFIMVNEQAETPVFAGEGDDWIEGLGGVQISSGDNGAPFVDSSIVGNDVFIGGDGPDDFDGESGDDIMFGGGGTDRMEGMIGFDWVTYARDSLGVVADMNIRAFNENNLPPSPASLGDRFDQVEGLSGSEFADILIGDDADRMEIETTLGVLTNFDLIDGLRGAGLNDIFTAGTTEWGEGNILLGGNGSDIIEGRGGDDIIDGDAWLNVQMEAPDEFGVLTRYDSMVELQARVFDPDPLTRLNPGDINIVREILPGDGSFNFDTAVFRGNRDEYLIEGIDTISDGDAFTTVTHVGAPGGGAPVPNDGVDRVRNIERLQFANVAIVLAAGLNAEPVGLASVTDTTPVVGQVMTASVAGVSDADNVMSGGAVTGPVNFTWQVEEEAGTGIFVDIPNDGVLGNAGNNAPFVGSTFTVTPDLDGLLIRVKAIYQDENGVLETVVSAPTAPVGTANVINGTPLADMLIGTAGVDLINGLEGDDRIQGRAGGDVLNGGSGADLIFGQTGNDVLSGGSGNDSLHGGSQNDIVDGGLGNDRVNGNAGNDMLSGGPGDDQVIGHGGNDVLSGGSGNDRLFGRAGIDIINGDAGADFLTGGTGNDVLNGGSGNDTINGGGGTLGGNDTLSGGEGNDRLNGQAGNDLLSGGIGNDVLLGGAGNDTIDGGDGDENIAGNAGNDLITGGAGDDGIQGGSGDDTIDAGSGADWMRGNGGNDTFVIRAGADTNVIGDFEGAGLGVIDVIDISDFGFANFGAVQAVMTDVVTGLGPGTVIDLAATDSVFVKDVMSADFDADDFLLV